MRLFRKARKDGPALDQSERWVLGSGTYEGRPIVLRINLQAIEAMRSGRYAYQVGVAVPLHFPDDRGFPGSGEADRLHEIEDLLVEAIAGAKGGVHVATLSTDGMREFVFYTCRPDPVPPAVKGLEERVKTHELQMMIRHDPQWTVFGALRAMLAKGPTARH